MEPRWNFSFFFFFCSTPSLQSAMVMAASYWGVFTSWDRGDWSTLREGFVSTFFAFFSLYYLVSLFLSLHPCRSVHLPTRSPLNCAYPLPLTSHCPSSYSILSFVYFLSTAFFFLSFLCLCQPFHLLGAEFVTDTSVVCCMLGEIFQK